eukprot:768475-Hanusia_phi.AAC.5
MHRCTARMCRARARPGGAAGLRCQVAVTFRALSAPAAAGPAVNRGNCNGYRQVVTSVCKRVTRGLTRLVCLEAWGGAWGEEAERRGQQRRRERKDEEVK